MFSKSHWLWAIGLILACGLGCSQSGNPHTPAHLSGKVTYKAKAVTGGTLRFDTKGAGVYSATIKADGTYSAADLPTGELLVTIETESLNPDSKKVKYGEGEGGDKFKESPIPKGREGTAGVYVKIPAKYSKKDQSGLTAILTTGKQVIDFNLTD